MTCSSRSSLAVACLAALACTGCSGEAGGSYLRDFPGGWVVFREARDLSALPMGDNLLANPDLEEGDAATFTGWHVYQAGCAVDAGVAYSGGRSVRLASSAETEEHGLYQTVTLHQTEARPIYFSGWNRAEGVTGTENGDFSIYLDLRYSDGTSLYGQTIQFTAGTHDWTLGEKVVVPDKPVESISFYLLLRRSHAGTAWFDQLSLREVETDVTTFDGELVYVESMDPWPFQGSDAVQLTAGDGLGLTLSARGGAILEVSSGAGSLQFASSTFASGFFVRDVAAGSDFIHLGGTAAASGTGGV